MGQLVRSLAAGRKASALFKSLSRVEVTFNPFDPSATTARTFLCRVRTPPVRKENPQLVVVAKISQDYGTPSIDLVYTDEERQSIAPAGSTISDILDQVERVARWKGGDGGQNPFLKRLQREATAKN